MVVVTELRVLVEFENVDLLNMSEDGCMIEGTEVVISCR